MKKQVDSQTDLLPLQVQEEVQESFQKAKVTEARAKDNNASSSESTQASLMHNKMDEHNRHWQGKQQQRKSDVVKVEKLSAVTDTEEVNVKITNENHPNMSSTIGGEMELSPPERKAMWDTIKPDITTSNALWSRFTKTVERTVTPQETTQEENK